MKPQLGHEPSFQVFSGLQVIYRGKRRPMEEVYLKHPRFGIKLVLRSRFDASSNAPIFADLVGWMNTVLLFGSDPL